MDIFDELRAFERIAGSNSLSQAARDLNLAPAGVSKRLAALEERLGVRLFHRSTRGLVLTNEGEAALARARRVVEEAEGLEAMFREQPERISGVLRIGAPSRFGGRYVVPAVADFLERHPNADAALYLTDRRQNLVAEGLDLAVRIGPSPDSGMIARKLADSRRIVCAAPAYLERRGTPLTPEELTRHDCLVLENNDVWRFRQEEGIVDVRTRPRVRCRESDAISSLCRQGIGIALKSVWDIHEDVAAGRLVALLPDFPVVGEAAISLLLPDRQFVPPKVRAFTQALKARIGSPPVWDSGQGG